MAILTAEKIEKIAEAYAGDNVADIDNIAIVVNRLAKSMKKSEFSSLAWDAMNATNKRNRYPDIKTEIDLFYSGYSQFSSCSCLVISGVCISMFALCEGRNI